MLVFGIYKIIIRNSLVCSANNFTIVCGYTYILPVIYWNENLTNAQEIILKEKVDIVKSEAPPKCLQTMCCSGLRSADVCVSAVDGV